MDQLGAPSSLGPKAIRSGTWPRFVARFSAWLDRWRRRLERLAPGNLSPQLSAGQDLPPKAYAAGFYVLVLHVRSNERRGYAKLYVDDGGGFSERDAYGLVTKHEKSVFRIVHLPRGARALRLEPSEQESSVPVPLFRFHRVPSFFARRRMLRRIGLEHLSLAGTRGRALRDAIAGYAQDKKLSREQALFRLYHDTFGLRRSRGDYDAWIRLVEAPADRELEPWPPEMPGPTLSVLVPVHDPEPDHLRACLESVLAQSYPHFELCIADDASSLPEVRAILVECALRDRRVRLHRRTEHGHICHASNDALSLASGRYVALLDHDDVLSRHALLRMVHALRGHPHAILLYSDEDKLAEDGARKGPHFKSQWNPDLLLSQAYMGHLLVARTSEVRELGGFRPGYEGSQDHDLCLRLSERCGPGQIVHVPHVLYHWRESERSTAQHPDAKHYAADAGRRAVADALHRRGVAARVDLVPHVAHGYRVHFAVPAAPPLASILVPTRDRVGLLRTCLRSLLGRTRYSNVEVLVIDNGSVEPDTLSYFEELSSDARVRIVRDDGPFNFSALNNRGVRQTSGELLVFLNNDVEVTQPDWLHEMVSHAVRPDIGCVGAKLLYPDDTVQHAGVITGIGGVAGHAHKYFHKDEHGYHGRLRLTHNVTAVTAACLVVRRSVFEQVGGLDEELAVAFNDVDLCLKVRGAGYRNLFTPHAVLGHHESASRGSESTERGQSRLSREARLLKERWGHTLRQDPYYSPHLSLEHEDFSIGLSGVESQALLR